MAGAKKKSISNISLGPGTKGSKHWIQRIINTPLVVHLNKQIGYPHITWISPVAADDYREYKLNQNLFRSALQIRGINHKISSAKFDFWPTGQPQWDAIGISSDGTLVLVEAKAHITETDTKTSATSATSLDRIKTTFEDTHEHLNGTGCLSDWLTKYYQYANRLSFFVKLSIDKDIPVTLVFLNIVADPGYKPTSKSDWLRKDADIHNSLLGNPQPIIPTSIQTLYFDAMKQRFI